MPPGPPPQPLERKRAAGNPGHRPLPSPRDTIALDRIPAKPPRGLSLGSEGRKLWVAVAELKWVATSDAASLVRACKLADLLEILDKDIEERGAVYEARGRQYVNPALAQRHAAEQRLQSYLASFGLSPADRTRQGIAEVKAASKMDELRERRATRG